MSERTDKLKFKLTQSRAHLISAINKIGNRSEEQIYSDGAGWTLRQLIVHLFISEKGIARVIRQVAEGESPITPDYDVNLYNSRSVEKQANMSLPEALQGLRTARADFLAWLDSIDDAKLDIVGRHPQQVDIPLWKFVEWQALHEQSHADDIERHLLQS